MNRGFTLVEILVSIAILSIVILGIFSVLNLGDVTWHSDTGLLYLQQGVRQAMESMIKEIRQSRSSDMAISEPGPNDGSRIQFKILLDINNNTYSDFITYYRNSDNQLIREYQSATQVLANDINSLNFSLSADMLETQLSAQKTVRGRVLSFPVTGALTEQVRLRNE